MGAHRKPSSPTIKVMSVLKNEKDDNHGRFYCYRIAWKYICPGSTKYLVMQKKKNNKKNKSNKTITGSHTLKSNNPNSIVMSVVPFLVVLFSAFYSFDILLLMKRFVMVMLSVFPISMLVFISFGQTIGLLKLSDFISLSLKMVSVITTAALAVNIVGIRTMIIMMVMLSSFVDGWKNRQWLIDSAYLCMDILHCDLKLCWWFLWWIVDTPNPVIFTNKNMPFNRHVFSFFHTNACWLVKTLGPIYMFSNGSGDNTTDESPEERKRRLARERKRKSRASLASKTR
jgi:hypothetical protein